MLYESTSIFQQYTQCVKRHILINQNLLCSVDFLHNIKHLNCEQGWKTWVHVNEVIRKVFGGNQVPEQRPQD